MLKQLKWNYLNFFKNYAWFYVAYGAVLVLWVLSPVLLGTSSGFVTLASFSGLFFYGFSFVLALQVMVGWLGRRTAQLELSAPVASWQRLLSKLIVAVSVNVTALPLSYLLTAPAKRWRWSGLTLFGFIHGLEGLLVYILFLLLFLTVVTFSYLLVSGARWARNHVKLLTALVTFALFLMLGLFSVFFFAVSGIWQVHIGNYVEVYINPKTNLVWLASLFSVAGPLGVTAAVFAGSCGLLAKRFEQY